MRVFGNGSRHRYSRVLVGWGLLRCFSSQISSERRKTTGALRRRGLASLVKNKPLQKRVLEMVEASVLLFKQEVTTVNQLVKIYSQARGEIVDTFKVVVDSYTNQKGSEGGKVCMRTSKEYKIDQPSKFVTTKQSRESITIERVLGVEVKRLLFRMFNHGDSTASSVAGMSSGSSQKCLAHIELLWHGVNSINQIIQFNFFLDNSSYFIDSASSEDITRKKDRYIALYKKRDWEALFQAADQVLFVAVISTGVNGPVLDRDIVSGLQLMLDIPREAVQAVLSIQKQFGNSFSGHFIWGAHRKQLRVIGRRDIVQHTNWPGFIVQPVITGEQVVCVAFDDCLVVFSEHIYVEKLPVLLTGVTAFIGVIQGHYIACFRVFVYEGQIIDRGFLQFQLMYQTLNNMSQSGQDYVIKTQSFSFAPLDSVYLQGDLQEFESMLTSDKHESLLSPGIRLQQDGFVLFNDRDMDIYQVSLVPKVTLYIVELQKDQLSDGFQKKYVNYVPFQLCTMSDTRATNFTANKKLYTISQGKSRSRQFGVFRSHIQSVSSIYWRDAALDKQEPLNNRLVTFAFDPSGDDTSCWIPLHSRQLSEWSHPDTDQYANQAILNTINPMTFADVSGQPVIIEIDQNFSQRVSAFVYGLVQDGVLDKSKGVMYAGDVTSCSIQDLLLLQTGANIRSIEFLVSDMDVMCQLVEEYNVILEVPRLFVPDISIILEDRPKSCESTTCIAIIDTYSSQTEDCIKTVVNKLRPDKIFVVYNPAQTRRLDLPSLDTRKAYVLTEQRTLKTMHKNKYPLVDVYTRN